VHYVLIDSFLPLFDLLFNLNIFLLNPSLELEPSPIVVLHLDHEFLGLADIESPGKRDTLEGGCVVPIV
jgi:hypothetical protein